VNLCVPAPLVFAQSVEDLEQVPVGQVGELQSICPRDPREQVGRLHVVDSDEVVEARQIGDEIFAGLEAENLAHEVFGDGLERVYAGSWRKFDALPLERSFADRWMLSESSPDRHADDDAIVALDFQ
jgi:hypothetical protein